MVMTPHVQLIGQMSEISPANAVQPLRNGAPRQGSVFIKDKSDPQPKLLAWVLDSTNFLPPSPRGPLPNFNHPGHDSFFVSAQVVASAKLLYLAVESTYSSRGFALQQTLSQCLKH